MGSLRWLPDRFRILLLVLTLVVCTVAVVPLWISWAGDGSMSGLTILVVVAVVVIGFAVAADAVFPCYRDVHIHDDGPPWIIVLPHDEVRSQRS
jgi:ABC-type nitrate/sulfonate/bicarbonate transport system permease component